MFKKILASLLGLFTIASASAATVNFCATNFVAGGSFTRPAIIQQVANKLPSDDAYVIVGQPLRLPATNGACWSVNLRYGTYRLDFEGFQFPKPLIFQVPNDTNTYSLLALAGLSPTNFIVASTSDFVQRNSGSATNLTLTTPLNLTGSTFLIDFAGGGSSLTLKQSGTFHWRGNGLFDQDLHAGNGLYADAGPIIGFNGLTVGNGVSDIATFQSNAVTVATVDIHGAFNGSGAVLTAPTGAPLYLSTGGFPAVGISMSGSTAFGQAIVLPDSALDAVNGVLAGNNGVLTSGPVTGNTVTGNTTVTGEHYIASFNHPVTITSGNIGSGSTFLVPTTQSDTDFQVAISTGTAAGTNDIFYVTYGTPFTSGNGTPIVTFSPATADAGALSGAFVDFDSASNNGFIFRATLQNNKSYRWNFHVIQ